MLISKDLTIIKNTQKELYKNRKIAKQMKYEQDEYIEKIRQIPLNWKEKDMRYFIAEKIMKVMIVGGGIKIL
jgi:hypothetical protein